MKDAEEEYVKCLMEIIELKHWNKDLVCSALVYFKRAQFYWQTLSRTKCAISSRLLSQK